MLKCDDPDPKACLLKIPIAGISFETLSYFIGGPIV